MRALRTHWSSGVAALPLSSPLQRHRQLADLVLHLARRQLDSEHRFTLLGWLWPLIRQLAQLAVLVFLFSKVLDLGIDDFPLFVFSALLVWSWFQAALTAATSVLVRDAHLVFSPGFPNIALPLVAVAVPLVDTLIALPVLVVMLAIDGSLHATALLLPFLLVAQLVLTSGLALVASSLNVYLRDMQNVVGVGLLLLFYLTPIFYGLKNVPERFQWLIGLNPLTPIVNSVRAVTLDGQLPDGGDVFVMVVTAAAAVILGVWVFRRLEPDLVDEL